MFVCLGIFKGAIWCHARFSTGSTTSIVTRWMALSVSPVLASSPRADPNLSGITHCAPCVVPAACWHLLIRVCVCSLPEKTPLLPTAAESYQQIQDQPHSSREQGQYNYGSRAPSLFGENNLRNSDFKYMPKGPPSSVYTPTGVPSMSVPSRDSGDPSAFHATQQYLSMTSGRPLSYSKPYQGQDQPYQAQARGFGDMESHAPLGADAAVTARSSMGGANTSRRSREDRLASLKGTVKRQEDISMA